MASLCSFLLLIFYHCNSQSFTLTANLSNITNTKVDKYVFGINPTGKTVNITANYTIARYGGETLSRSANKCKDWYFLDEIQAPSWQEQGDICTLIGLDLLTQIPAMGWVSSSKQKLYSFSQNKYGKQQKNECTGQPTITTWCIVGK